MRTTAKVVAFIIGFILIAGYLGSKSNNGKPAAEPEQVQAEPAAKPPPDVEHVGSGSAVAALQLNDVSPSDPYDANSTERFDPNQLVKNAYQWRGHSGILNTIGIPIMALGRTVDVVPMPSMKFERMLDAETALYEVTGYENDAQTYDELAVLVNDSVAPDVRRAWRILVEGPLKGTNAYGGTITVTEVRFEGYYVAPKPTPEQQAQQAVEQAAAKAAWDQKVEEGKKLTGGGFSGDYSQNTGAQPTTTRNDARPAMTQHQADCARMAQYHDSSTVKACEDVNGGQQ